METDEYAPEQRQPTIRVVPMPAETNSEGDIFGGWIMSHVDIAGSIAAARRAQGRVVTVAVNALQFKKPVFVGDLVSFYADVVGVGRTSITVDVTVYVERGWHQDKQAGRHVKVTDATLTYVAIDDAGQKRPVPPES